MRNFVVAQLRTAAVDDFSGIRFADPLIRADRDRAELVQVALQQGDCVVAVDGADVFGYAVFNYSFFGNGFIPLLVVAMANRRGGIGSQLLQEVERRCVRPKLFTSTNRSNMVARWLFEKEGFTPSGHIENLDAEDDEVIYFKDLARKA